MHGVWIPFTDTQVKSATGNSGEYGSTPNISKQLHGTGTPTTGITHIDKVIRALSELSPGAKVHTYTNNAAYNRQAKERGGKNGQHSSAFYDNRDGSIHINLNRAKDNTLFHEAAHPVLTAVIAGNPELLNDLYAQLEQHPDFAKYKKFAERYDEGQRKVEAVVEYMADVAAGKARSSALRNSMYQKFKAWLKDLLNRLGFRGVKLDPTNLKQFAEDFATAVTEGRKIKLRTEASSTQEGMAVFAQDHGITVEEAKRQYAEVVAQYTNPDGTKKEGWMKAPNGKATNLNELQWVQTRTPAFLNWFGDFLNDPKNASKVVDANGDPMVVYHGTRRDFDVFRSGYPRAAFGNPKGIYFDSDKRTAEEYAIDVDGAEDSRSRIVEAFVRVLGNGDGEVRHRVERGSAEIEVIAADPAQIKSATGNTGQFDPETGNINESRNGGGRVDLVSLTDNRGRIVDSRVRDLATRILDGRSAITRLNPAEERGRNEGGRVAVEATLLLAAEGRASGADVPDGGGRAGAGGGQGRGGGVREAVRQRERQEDLLTRYAKRNNLWFTEADIAAKAEGMLKPGTESKVWREKVGSASPKGKN